MTEIGVVSTGSKGNGFVIKSNGETLVLELGCRYMDYAMQERNLYNIVGAVCSHKHSDHINPSTYKHFQKRGIRCYAHEEVIKDADFCGFSPLVSDFRNKVGGFVVQTFKAPHNVPNYGFLITTPSNERVLFLTDTTGVNLRFRDVDCIMVECNHDDDTLLDNLSDNDVSMSHPEFHMGLDECKKFCKANISSSTKQVILIHLSSMNVNEQHAIDTIKEYCNFSNVAVAHKGDTFKIESDDF